MENGYRLELWHDAYVMLGSSSAALIGLLFIATSLHLEEIVKNPAYRVRAQNNTRYLLVTLIEAVLVLIPQSDFYLGGELIVLNLLWMCLPVRNVYRFFYKDKQVSGRGGWTIYRAIIFIFSFLLGAVGGAGVIAQQYWGMFLVTISYVTFIFTIVLNAWSIMLGVGQSEVVTKSRQDTSRHRR